MNSHRSFRSAMAWLHTWTGLLLGWVLYAIFITGTAAYFRPEITAWMQPETAVVSSPADAARIAFARLQDVAPDASRWLIAVPDTRSRELKIMWRPAAGGRFQNETLDPSGERNSPPRATLGGEFFYRFHFQLMLPHPWGRWLASTAALFMLVALVSGIVTHRRFFKDLFLFRLGRDGRRPWLDFHNVTAVLALPFYLMISYSALVIFTPMLLPLAKTWLAPSAAAGSASNPSPVAGSVSTPSASVNRELDRAPSPNVAGSVSDPSASFDRMLAHVETTWGSARPLKRVDFTHRATDAAAVTFTRADGPSVSHFDRETLTFSALTGHPLDKPTPAVSLGHRIRSIIYGLHLANFASPLLRTLFFLMGFMGAAMVGTGLVLWTLKRKDRLPAAGRAGRFAYHLVSRLNISAITGLPLACAAFLWANRLVPVGQSERADTETSIFLVVWAAAALHACIRPAASAWREQFIAAAVAFGALPLVDLLTAGRQLDTWPRADALYTGFTVAFLVLGALFAYGARTLTARSRAIRSGKTKSFRSVPAPADLRVSQDVR